MLFGRIAHEILAPLGARARQLVLLIILDRDPLYTAAFRRLLRDSGVKPLVLPAWSPNLNAFAERFVRSAKAECLERIVLLGEKHLRAAVREFIQHAWVLAQPLAPLPGLQ